MRAERVFLCHSSGDKEQVRDLYRRLRGEGFWPWLDEEDILAGQDWESEIRRAISESRYVLVCLSKGSVDKRGYVQKEIRLSLDAADRQPDGSVFLIPIRIEDCEVPERLRALQWVDLFKAGGYERLVRSLRGERPPGGLGVPPGEGRAAAPLDHPEPQPGWPDGRLSLRKRISTGLILGLRWRRLPAAVLLLLAAVIGVVLAVRSAVGETGVIYPGPFATLAPQATAQSLGEPLPAHTKAARSLAFAPGEGTILASGGYDQAVRLWDMADPVHPRSLGVPVGVYSGPVYSVAFPPDNETILAIGSEDQPVRLWNVADPDQPTLLGELEGHSRLMYSVAFSPGDGAILAAGGDDGTVRLWDVVDPTRPRLLGEFTGHTHDVRSVAFTPDGRVLATGGADHMVRLWDVSAPTQPQPPLLAELEGHTAEVTSVAFAPNGLTLATSGGKDQSVRLWDVSAPTQPQLLTKLEGDSGEVLSVTFALDGRTLASGDGNTVRLWDVSDPTRARLVGQPLEGHHDYVRSLAFAPDGMILASGDNIGTVLLWPVG